MAVERPPHISLWQVVELLTARCPHLKWDPRRVAAVLDDFPHCEPVPVAGRCADWLAFEAKNARNGPAALRTFFEKAHKEQLLVRDDRRRGMDRQLATYDRFLN